MVTGQISPMVSRRLLASDLRRHRILSGRTIDQVARHLECSPAKVSRMETGAVGVGIQDLRAILELYGISGREHEDLLALGRRARQRGWWHEFADVVPPGSATFYGLEDGAASIGQHCASLVPGLLQTAAYARALIESVPGAAPAVVERRVQLRRRRQQLLERPQPPRLHLVLDEAVLCRQIGGATVLAEQLEHLLAMAERPQVQMQVLPFDAGAHPAAGVSFTVFGFPGSEDTGECAGDEPDAGEGTVVFREQLDANSFVDEPEQVAVYTSALAEASRAAADVERSHELVASRLAQLR